MNLRCYVCDKAEIDITPPAPPPSQARFPCPTVDCDVTWLVFYDRNGGIQMVARLDET